MSKNIDTDPDFPDLTPEQIARFRHLPGKADEPLYTRLQRLKKNQSARKKEVLFDEDMVNWFTQKGMDISSLVTPMLKEFIRQNDAAKHV